MAVGCGSTPPAEPDGTTANQPATPVATATPVADERAASACGRYSEAAGKVESLLSKPDDVHPGAFGTTLVQWAAEIDTITEDAPRVLREPMATAAEAVRWIERTLRRPRVQTSGLALAVEEWRTASQDVVLACQPYS